MAEAYIKVWVQAGKERAVRDALRDTQGVTRADLTAGEQDMILLVEAPTNTDILAMVVNRIRQIHGVERTATNLIVE